VERITRVNKIVALHGYRTRHYSVRKPSVLIPNLVKRQFDVERPNRVWAMDTTYVRTWEGWLYLAVVMVASETARPFTSTNVRTAASGNAPNGCNWRASTKTDSLALAKQFAEDWYLNLRGQSHAGLLEEKEEGKEVQGGGSEIPRGVADPHHGQRSERYVNDQKKRLAAIPPFLGDRGDRCHPAGLQNRDKTRMVRSDVTIEDSRWVEFQGRHLRVSGRCVHTRV
jgi:hypothetical protein